NRHAVVLIWRIDRRVIIVLAITGLVTGRPHLRYASLIPPAASVIMKQRPHVRVEPPNLRWHKQLMLVANINPCARKLSSENRIDNRSVAAVDLAMASGDLLLYFDRFAYAPQLVRRRNHRAAYPPGERGLHLVAVCEPAYVFQYR